MDALNLDPVVFALAAAVLALIAVILMVIITMRQRRLLKRYRMLLNGPTGHDLEALLLNHSQSLDAINQDLTGLKEHLATVSSEAKGHVQKLAVVRFNAFPDTGSDLSFAIAVLDANDNGVVLSSLYGRSECRTYAKPISSGTSSYTLSVEEKEAIAKARNLSK